MKQIRVGIWVPRVVPLVKFPVWGRHGLAEKRRQDKIISKNGIFRLQVLITLAFFQTIEV